MVRKKFAQDGDKVFIFDLDDTMARDILTPAIYTVCHDPFRGFFLQKNKDNFNIPDKAYGSLNPRTDRIINTYEQRTSGTGVLLTGLKGSGKTLLSQKVSNKLLQKGLPVILVEDSHSGDGFITFINSIGECVLIFDEFTKVFQSTSMNERNSQDELLGIFDGNKSLKRLIFVIDNEARSLNEFYTNRPGRLFYHFEYSKLEEIVIDEYCADYGIPDSVKAQIKSAYYRIRYFSFDILKAIVDEHLRYPKEEIIDIVNVLNIDTDSYYKTCITLSKIVQKSTNKEFEAYKETAKEIEFDGQLRIDYYIKEKGVNIKVNEDDDEYDSPHLKFIRIQEDTIIFENKEKVICMYDDFLVEFKKSLKSNFDYMAL